LGGEVVRHEPICFFYFFVGAFDHAADDHLRLRVELVELHSQVTRVVRGVDFRRLGWGGFLLDEF
jgi:hypothetical protein